jgi:hypothetical protein
MGGETKRDDSECARLIRPRRIETPKVSPAPKPELRTFPGIAWHPDSYKAVQRIVLRAQGKQYDFVGYLRVRDSNNFRALALGEMGGTLFDLALEGGEPRIFKKPENMPPQPLLDGVIGDIRFLFAAGPLRVLNHEYVPLPDWGYVLNVWTDTVNGPDGSQVYRFDESGQLIGSRETWKGRTVRCASLRDWRLFPGCDRALPGRILLENRRWHYEMEIELLKYEAEQPSQKRDDEPQTKGTGVRARQ